MKRASLTALALLASLAVAHAFGLGKEGFQFGHMGFPGGKKVVVVAQPTGKILMVDNVSHILMVDGTSRICRAGGC